MLKHLPLVLLCSATLALAAPATLATVNGKAITTTDANAFLAKAAPGMSFDKLDPKMKRQVVDQLVNQNLVKAKAIQSGIQNTPQFKLRYAELKDDLAVDMWMKQQMDTVSVNDKEIKTFYDANKDKMKQGDKTLTLEQAKGDITRFIKLEKFKTLMNKTSESLRASAKVEVKL